MVDHQQWLAYTDWLKQRGQHWPRLGQFEAPTATVQDAEEPNLAEADLQPVSDQIEAPVQEPATARESSPEIETPVDAVADLRSRIALCQSCDLASCRDLPDANLTNPWGEPGAPLVFLWDGRGKLLEGEETARNLLAKMASAMGLSPDQYYCVPVLSCPVDMKPQQPAASIAACRPHWQGYLSYQPRVVIPMGALATQAVFGARCHFPSLRGQAWQSRLLPNSVIVPTYHPRDLVRVPSGKRQAWADLQLAMQTLDSAKDQTP